MFRKLRKKFVSVKEMNEHLKYVFKYYNVQYRKKNNNENMGMKAFIEDKNVYFDLTYKKGSIVCTYVCRKDSIEEDQQIDGMEAHRIMSMYYKVPKLNKKYPTLCGSSAEGTVSASPLLWFNPKYNNTEQYAYGYDMNAAYSYAMLQPIPDTSVKSHSGTIIEGKEIGFREYPNPKNPNANMLVAVYSGYSMYIFPLMESPFKEFVKRWYERKSNSKNKIERKKAKCVLNYSIGYLQRINPFIRATIITRCNNLIKSYIDEENTLFCNTDSIVTKKPLNLKIGKNIGEWKLEHEGYVRYKDYAYQWDDGTISYRRVPKSWFSPDFNLLTDEIPKQGNIYVFKNNRLEAINNENI